MPDLLALSVHSRPECGPRTPSRVGGVAFPAVLMVLSAPWVVSVGCGGQVVIGGSEGSGGGGGEVGGSTGLPEPPNPSASTGLAAITSATASASSVSSSGSGTSNQVAPGCKETSDTFDLAIVTPEGDHYGCSGASTNGTLYGDVSLRGTLVSHDGQGKLELDTCPPNADCDGPTLAEVFVAAPGLHLPIPPGIFVDVKARVFGADDGISVCIHRVQITSPTSWNGIENPYQARLWLAASDGFEEPVGDMPFGISAVPLGCHPGETATCGEHESYVWRFADPAEPQNTRDVPMGHTDPGWKFGSGDDIQVVALRNLRSFSSGVCDDYVNWAYWAAPP